MARQNINNGASANDNTGDTLRQAAQKINENFVELYLTLGGDSDNVSQNIQLTDTGILFEGQIANAHETLLYPIEPTADRTVYIPDASGTLLLDSATQTLSNKTHQDPKLVHPDIYDSAGAANFYALVPPTAAGMTKSINLRLPTLTDSDTLVSRTSTGTLTNKTLTTAVLTNPRVSGSIFDAAANEAITVTATGSAVNHINVTNAATGSGPSITAIGDDSNIDLILSPKGTGKVNVNSPISFKDSDYFQGGPSAISLTATVSLLNCTSPTTFTLANGTGGQMMQFVSVNTAAVTVNPSTFGTSPGNTFIVQPYAAVTAIYNDQTNNSARVGWYLVGMDSAGGLGNKVIIS